MVCCVQRFKRRHNCVLGPGTSCVGASPCVRPGGIKDPLCPPGRTQGDAPTQEVPFIPSFTYDLPIAHLNNAIRSLPNFQRVCDNHKRLPIPFIQVAEQVHDLRCRLAIQVARWLVGPYDRWIIGEGACNGDTLPLTPGELGRSMAGTIG